MPEPKAFITDEEMEALSSSSPPEFIPDEAPAPQPAAPRVPLSDFSISGFEPPEQFLARPEVQEDLRVNGPARARTVIQTAVPLAAGLAFSPPVGIAARVGLAGLLGAGGSLAAEAIDPSESAAQAMTRAATGAAAGAAGEGVGLAVRAAAPAVSRFAQTQGAKALGLIQGGFRKTGVDGARAMAQAALDEGIISPLASAETMLGRAVAAGDDAGQQLGGFRAMIDSLDPGDDALQIAQRLESTLTDWQPGTSNEAVFKPQMQRAVDDLLAYADPQTGRIGAEALAKLKRDLADTVYTDPLLSAAQLTGRLKPRTEIARGVVQGAEEDLAGRVLSPEDFESFLAQKSRYGAMSKAQEALEQRVARDAGNNQVFGLSNQLGGIIGGTALGGPLAGVGALGGAVGTRLLYQRGNQISATAANRLAQIAASSGSPLAIRTAAQAIVASLEDR